MDVQSILSSLIVPIASGILGFIIGTISGWIAAKWERRKLVQERYTQQYLTDGLYALIQYFVHLERQLKSVSDGDYLGLPESNPFPVRAEAAMRMLCGDSGLTKAFSGINVEYGSLLDIVRVTGLDWEDAYKGPLDETVNYIEHLNKVLLRARKDLEDKIAKINWRDPVLDTAKTCEILNEIEEYEPELLKLARQIVREKNRGTSSET